MFGNLKHLKSNNHYGGYGHRLGHPYGYDYGQYGYGRRISVDTHSTPVYGHREDYTDIAVEHSNTVQSQEYRDNQYSTEHDTQDQEIQYLDNQYSTGYSTYHNYGY